jgi:hypothetical protein
MILSQKVNIWNFLFWISIVKFDPLFQTINYVPLVPFVEISGAAIDVLKCFHSSQLAAFFNSFVKKSEAVIDKRNEDVTCFSCLSYYLLTNTVEWICLSLHQSFVQIRSFFFFLSFRVRNSKFLGFSRPALLVSRTPKYRTSFSYSRYRRKLPNYLRVQFYCYADFLIFIIYYDFTLARRRWLMQIKLVFALYDYPSLANEKCAQL